MIVVDCLRPDHLSKASTPNVDYLKQSGTVYTEAYSMGSTTKLSSPYIISEYLLLNLRRIGYNTTVIHSNPHITMLMRNKPAFTLDLGKKSKWKIGWDYLTKGVHCPWLRAEKMNQIAMKILENPVKHFLILWYMDVHLPYLPPQITNKANIFEKWKLYQLNKKLRTESQKRTYKEITIDEIKTLQYLYDKEVEHFDLQLGKLLKTVNMEETIILLMADHGEEFMEEGDLGHPNKPCQTLLHVPLIIHNPKQPSRIINEKFTFDKLDKLILNSISQFANKGEST
jgi:hypothetical protein